VLEYCLQDRDELVARTKNNYHSALSRSIAARRSAKHAFVTVIHTLLAIAFHIPSEFGAHWSGGSSVWVTESLQKRSIRPSEKGLS